MIDISCLGFQFRGAPVTIASEGVMALLGQSRGSQDAGLRAILRAAADVEPSGCICQSRAVGDVTVWMERFGCTYEQGHHEGGAWSVFLPNER